MINIFDDNSMPDYLEWKRCNSDNFTWWNYINIKSDIDTALAFAKFYCPDVIVADGCFLLKDKFSEENYCAWKSECNGEKTAIEKMMNLYAIKDFFHINSLETDDYKSKVIILGEVLKYFWTVSFKNRFPERYISVDVFKEDDDEIFITVYENPQKSDTTRN